MVPNDMIHVNLRYLLGTGATKEEANYGFYMKFVDETLPTGAIDLSVNINWQSAIDALAGDIVDSHVTLWDAVKSVFPAAVKPDSVKITHLDNDGHELHGARAGLVDGPGTGTPTMPFQTSLVVTLFGYVPGTFTTDRARKRNRFYLPPLHAGAMLNTGVIDNGTRDVLLDGYDAFFEDLQGKRTTYGSAPSFDPGYWAMRTLSRVGAGRQTQVEAIGIGNVIDTQRRRRRSLPEIRATRDLSHV